MIVWLQFNRLEIADIEREKMVRHIETKEKEAVALQICRPWRRVSNLSGSSQACIKRPNWRWWNLTLSSGWGMTTLPTANGDDSHENLRKCWPSLRQHGSRNRVISAKAHASKRESNKDKAVVDTREAHYHSTDAHLGNLPTSASRDSLGHPTVWDSKSNGSIRTDVRRLDNRAPTVEPLLPYRI